MKSLRLPLLAAGLLCAALATAADWPQFRGPNRDDVSKETGLIKTWTKDSPPPLVWTFDKGGAGFSGPAVVGDRLYTMGSDDPDQGKDEYVFCLSTKDGTELWRTPVGTAAGRYNFGYGNGPRSTPTVDGDRLYALGAKGDLLCLTLAKGEKVWHKNLVSDLGGGIPGWGYAESVLIDGDHLICTPGGGKGTLAALDKKTGEVVWRSSGLTDGAQYASPIIAEVGGVKMYVTMTKAGVVAVRAKDGKFLWRNSAGANGTAVIPTPVFDGENVFVTSGYGSGCGLIKLTADSSGGVTATEVYRSKLMVDQHGGVVRLGDYIYGHSDRGGWLCIEYKENRDKPVWDSGKLGKGSILYADGSLYCYSEGNGTLAKIKATPDGWEEQGRFTIPKRTKIRGGAVWTHPVIANGKLYLRDKNYIFCYDVKGK